MAGTLRKQMAAGIVAMALAVAMFTSVLVAGPADGASPAKRGGCPWRNASWNEQSAQHLRSAMRCLIDAERRKAGKVAVVQNSDLGSVAARHTEVMHDEDCLSHQCSGERSLKTRIIHSGYPYTTGKYGFGEVTGCATTPAEMIDAWMASDYHRRQILGGAYRNIGVGLVKGDLNRAGCASGGLREIYAVIFAWRKH